MNITVKKMKELLDKFPDDFELWAHEKGSVYDVRVTEVYIHPKDKNRVTLHLSGTV
jgi:hypothetical protein